MNDITIQDLRSEGQEVRISLLRDYVDGEAPLSGMVVISATGSLHQEFVPSLLSDEAREFPPVEAV